MPAVKLAKTPCTTPQPVPIPCIQKKSADKNQSSFIQVPRVKTPEVTLSEGFLGGYSILEPVHGVLPPVEQVLENAPKQRIIVGLSGVSNGGKTTLAKALLLWLGENGDIIMQDDHYYPPETLVINPITNFPEFDEPEAIKWHEVKDRVTRWKNRPYTSSKTEVLIVEGTMIFTDPEICALCDLRYVVHVDFDTAKYRRAQRKYPIPDPPHVVAKNIWPKYIKHRTVFEMLAQDNGFRFKQIDGRVIVDHTIAGIIQDVKVSKH